MELHRLHGPALIKDDDSEFHYTNGMQPSFMDRIASVTITPGNSPTWILPNVMAPGQIMTIVPILKNQMIYHYAIPNDLLKELKPKGDK